MNEPYRKFASALAAIAAGTRIGVTFRKDISGNAGACQVKYGGRTRPAVRQPHGSTSGTRRRRRRRRRPLDVVNRHLRTARDWRAGTASRPVTENRLTDQRCLRVIRYYLVDLITASADLQRTSECWGPLYDLYKEYVHSRNYLSNTRRPLIAIVETSVKTKIKQNSDRGLADDVLEKTISEIEFHLLHDDLFNYSNRADRCAANGIVLVEGVAFEPGSTGTMMSFDLSQLRTTRTAPRKHDKPSRRRRRTSAAPTRTKLAWRAQVQSPSI
ncbi:hypothetical protein EVAR_7674_1 [Eumeta japonica]|uniref:Uncharacterized protein n=1 Tax=Eumeta variegata TaxID=151549 RepID=A0A4C1TIA8_EUMVA|nr:hypothetical protein EVAR_7674_1 [Eumeta japonica]